MITSFEKELYELVRQIPKGKVTTYLEIAKAMGRPQSARAVGNALHKNPNPISIPCHRVVSSSGRLSSNFAFGGLIVQKELLIKEGVDVQDDKVDLSKYMYLYRLLIL